MIKGEKNVDGSDIALRITQKKGILLENLGKRNVADISICTLLPISAKKV